MRRPLSALALAVFAGCVGGGEGLAKKQAKTAVFVGIDVSGSFHKAGLYDDSLEFIAHYIYAHVNELGKLHPLKALFVGTLGGMSEDDPKSFRPIQDFQGKSVEQILADLKAWFPKADKFTDFNEFFKQVSMIAQKRNLSLSPITIIILSDGIPATLGKNGKAEVGRLDKIDLSSLEYLSRKVTVRLLYADPGTASKWETGIPRQRLRMWTVDYNVMKGWKRQLDLGVVPEQQEKLWKWVADNVDYRVRPVKFRFGKGK